jgi:hypothetical protein
MPSSFRALSDPCERSSASPREFVTIYRIMRKPDGGVGSEAG